MCPPAPVFPREPIEDVTLDGHTIPAGTTLIVPPFLVHRDARWFDAPEEWRPSRWTDTMRAELPRFAYFPFGGGPRICIGAHLATAEARIVLAELLRRFALTPAEGAALTLVPSITMRPTAPVELVIRRR
jgi:cytochrome P450